MSASVYGDTMYRPPTLPKVHYPPMFDGLNRISFRHVLDSKYLALSVLLFLVGLVINIICIIMPFWFKLVFSSQDGTFGTLAVKQKLAINTGIFFMNEEQFDNLLDLNEHSNHDVVPKLLTLAQVLEIIGTCSLVACLAGATILTCRRFASVPANFILAFFSSITGLFLLMVFLLGIIIGMSSSCDPYDTGSSCSYKDNLVWRQIPMYSQAFRLESEVTPLIKLNWVAYIAVIAPILTLAGSALIWLDAFSSYKSMTTIRYKQLTTPRDPHENDVQPHDQGKYKYQPPVQQGSMTYGMQPVMVQGNPYQPPMPQQGYNVGFQQPSAPSIGFKEPPSSRGVGFSDFGGSKSGRDSSPPPPARRRSPPPARRRSPSPDDEDDDDDYSPPSHRRHSPPPRRGAGGRRSPSPPSRRRRSPSPPPRRGGGGGNGPPSMNSSMSEGGPYISREIDL